MARRSGLGRGLGALIPSEAARPTSRAGLHEIPLGRIRPNKLQPRTYFDEAALASLVDSIRAVGILQPVLVREVGEDEYELIAGERRWRAARRAGLLAIPALVQVADDEASLEQALVENLHREGLNPLDEAAAYQQLIEDFHLTHDAVSQPGRQEPRRGDQRPAALPAATDGAAAGARRPALRRPRPRPADDAGPCAAGVAGAAGGRRGALGAGRRAARPRRRCPRCLAPRPRHAAVPTRREPLRPPGVLELEELLAAHLNTRVRVEVGPRRGRVIDRVRQSRGSRAHLPADDRRTLDPRVSVSFGTPRALGSTSFGVPAP